MKYLLFILCFVSFSSHAMDTWGILNSFDLDQTEILCFVIAWLGIGNNYSFISSNVDS